MTKALASHSTLPPFDSSLPTAPLVSISLAKLEAGDVATEVACYNACRDLGFFYLDMLGSDLGEQVVDDAERLNKVQTEFFDLPNEAKDEFGRDKVDPLYSYRYRELETLDENGQPGRVESYNVSKDDILGYKPRLPVHPIILNNNDVFKDYTLHCRKIVDILIKVLETNLGLVPGALADLHRLPERSADHVRWTAHAVSTYSEERAKRAEHTDFGSFTILFNWLGGLQLLLPQTEKWVWVKPVPGSAVINLGDAMVKFTSGILRSNIHRVVPAYGAQAHLKRTSLIYFARPEDDVVLKRIQGGIISDRPAVKGEDESITAVDWIFRRSLGDLMGIYTFEGGVDRRFTSGHGYAK